MGRVVDWTLSYSTVCMMKEHSEQPSSPYMGLQHPTRSKQAKRLLLLLKQVTCLLLLLQQLTRLAHTNHSRIWWRVHPTRLSIQDLARSQSTTRILKPLTRLRRLYYDDFGNPEIDLIKFPCLIVRFWLTSVSHHVMKIICNWSSCLIMSCEQILV